MKSPKKWTYLNEYKRSADGDYVYTGGFYRPADEARYGRRLRNFACLCALPGVFVIAQGLLNAGGMKNTFYVLLPFLGEAICLFVLVWNTVRLVYAGSRLKRYVYESVTGLIPGSLLFLAVFAAAAFVGSLVFLVFGRAGEALFPGILLPALDLFAAVSGFLLRRYFRTFRWTPV